jgi:hypothetical protein
LLGELVAIRWHDIPKHGTGPYNVVVVVRNRNGKVILRGRRYVILKRVQPNGTNCPPTCFNRSLVLDARQRRLKVET